MTMLRDKSYCFTLFKYMIIFKYNLKQSLKHNTDYSFLLKKPCTVCLKFQIN